ncbi:uncharacterized protein zgc:171844 isoform X3 [Melanotaenia boesemani]|uniref:uncharacterized protein zgc:171844 isoform X3 n=1 Tax=Melanotaenia boesemani TaxID=1250792 RepID=UPI001C03BDAB|nr:uncharacterized protein zgc:171844 isoform X3 [Melanotaenia boesemani]
MKDGTRMDVSRDMKHVILEKLGETMYKYTAYPTHKCCKEVASALVVKHPCLKEVGSPSGDCGWKNSIKFKKMRRSGMADVTVNKRRKDFPEGETSEIVEEQPPVKRMMERRPLLFTEIRCSPSSVELQVRTSRKTSMKLWTTTPLLQPINTQDSDTVYDFTQVPVGVLRAMTEDTPPQMNSFAIILEGNIVMDEISTTSQALCLLFGLMYALHLDYPKGVKSTFEFIQKILLNLGTTKAQPKTANTKKCSFELDVG